MDKVKQILITQLISFGVDSVADNKENKTKMEEYVTPSKRGDLGGRRRQIGSSKNINAIAK